MNSFSRRSAIAVCSVAAIVLLWNWREEERRSDVTPSAPQQAERLNIGAPSSGSGTAAPGAAGKVEAGERRAPCMAAADDDADAPWAARRDLSEPAVRAQVAQLLRGRAAKALALADRSGARAGPDVAGRGDGTASELVEVRDGRVYVYTTFNADAAISAAVPPVRDFPPYLTGAGVAVGLWDAGAVRATHQELAGRTTIRDSSAAVDDHATHGAGTMAASGTVPAARGMAPAASIDSYNWLYDEAELAERAMAAPGEPGKLQLGNRSYGVRAGWAYSLGGWSWYGRWGNAESESFGLYDDHCATLDALVWGAPYFLLCAAAGDDRDDTPPPEGAAFSYYDGVRWRARFFDEAVDPKADGWHGGYDTIPLTACAKNILTVGSVEDAVAGGLRAVSNAQASGFSGWGPVDDGRVKPDLVANGSAVYSCGNAGDTNYVVMSGSSMASASACGAAALLLEHHAMQFPGHFLRAATLKGLMVHTADDLGREGPDYEYGWGLLNIAAAIAQDSGTHALREVEDEVTVAERTRMHTFLWDNVGPIKITLCWTDPPGTGRTGLNDRAPSLVHDLELRLIDPTGAEHLPYVLDVANPDAPATAGENHVDNIEQVVLASPPTGGVYRVAVSVHGALTSDRQPYSLLVSGATEPPLIGHDPLENSTNTLSAYEVMATAESEWPLDTGMMEVLWNTSGNTNFFNSAPLFLFDGDLYLAEIPALPPQTPCHYWLKVRTINGIEARLPAGAPAEMFSFIAGVPSVPLVVAGVPAEVPNVTPSYGVTLYPSGVTVNASADLFSAGFSNLAFRCDGWQGSGDAPASGTGNSMSFVLRGPSTLTWQWSGGAYLYQTSTVPGVVQSMAWHALNQEASTVIASNRVIAGGTSYRFVGWYVDGVRQAGASGVAVNPVAGIAMTGDHDAVAEYVPEVADGDGNGLADWWEIYCFGSTGITASADSDGDTYSNALEARDNSDPLDPASIPRPPVIAHAPLGSPQPVPAPWLVSAGVADSSEVSVQLQWRANGSGWRTAPMSAAGGGDVYTNSIPQPGVEGDAFEYRIVATDAAGLASASGPYAFEVRYPVINLSPPDFGFVRLPASTLSNVSLRVHNPSRSALNWAVSVEGVGMRDDLESGGAGWTHGGIRDLWHMSAERSYSGACAWYMGLDGIAVYRNTADASLISPEFYMGPAPQLSFRCWIETELLDDRRAWDGLVVDLSTNNGASFFPIAPVGGYPFTIYGPSYGSPFPLGQPCLAGSGGWQRVQFDLSAYAYSAGRLRFRFGADGENVAEGCYLDDIMVTPDSADSTWLSVVSTGGVQAAGASTNVLVQLDSSPLPLAETRSAFLRVLSNDPGAPSRLVFVTLHNNSRSLTITVTPSEHGLVAPTGTVIFTVGDLISFHMKADRFYHVHDIQTNGASVPDLPFNLAETNFVWHGITDFAHLLVEFGASFTRTGVPEIWLSDHGFTNAPPEEESLADQDGDRSPTWHEYFAGTDPNDRESCLRITDVQAAPDALRIWWPSASNRLYRLQVASNLVNGFVSIASNLPATPPTNCCPLAAGVPGCYRVIVVEPAP